MSKIKIKKNLKLFKLNKKEKFYSFPNFEKQKISFLKKELRLLRLILKTNKDFISLFKNKKKGYNKFYYRVNLLHTECKKN